MQPQLIQGRLPSQSTHYADDLQDLQYYDLQKFEFGRSKLTTHATEASWTLTSETLRRGAALITQATPRPISSSASMNVLADTKISEPQSSLL